MRLLSLLLVAHAGTADAEPRRVLWRRSIVPRRSRAMRSSCWPTHRFLLRLRFAPNHKVGGTIDPKRCGYVPRKNKARSKVLEWEHVVPPISSATRARAVAGHIDPNVIDFGAPQGAAQRWSNMKRQPLARASKR